MDFIWNEKTLDWFRTASAYTGFHSELASIVRPRLADCETLCDMGCGLGLLDLELAKDLRSVLCVDQSEAAIGALRELIRARGARNIVARVADVNDASAGERWDAVLMSFFGSSLEDIARFLAFCDKRMILIVHEKATAGRCVNAVSLRPKPFGAAEVTGFLTGRKLPFQQTHAAIEFGQPFKSLEDARDFIRIYTSSMLEAAGVGGPAERERLYGDMESRLVETGRADYPVYLPKPKRIAVFVVEKAAQRDSARTSPNRKYGIL
ncbi:MAG: class I SAM-dependent methyltransferase [Clostridiales Family XIII bacterium]|jgi:SAM-dependent methyltransferase|nr:class I SAM-dependent methyltransferase [Clostridiales Family XIII bacterium]